MLIDPARRFGLGVFVLALVAAGCDPSPGTRLAVDGTLSEVPADPRGFGLEVTVEGDRFYWIDGGAVRSRALNGGPDTVLAASNARGTSVAVTRDDVVFWDDNGVAAVPRAGGAVRRFGAEAGTTLVALDEAVIWAVFRANGASALVGLRTKEPGALPRDLASFPDAAIVSFAGAGDAFAVVVRTAREYRVDLHDAFGGAARTLYRVPHPESSAGVDLPSIPLVLGTEHAFILHPSHSLSTEPVALVALPRTSGPPRVLTAAACPGQLAVVGDDPIYLGAKGACPGVLATARRLELRRESLSKGTSTIVYAGFSAFLTATPAGPGSLLVSEDIPVKGPKGSAPAYTQRSARLLLRSLR